MFNDDTELRVKAEIAKLICLDEADIVVELNLLVLRRFGCR